MGGVGRVSFGARQPSWAAGDQAYQPTERPTNRSTAITSTAEALPAMGTNSNNDITRRSALGAGSGTGFSDSVTDPPSS